MTNQEINIAIAESVGWKPCYKGCHGKTWRYPDDSGCTEKLPDYFNDLNAMHEIWMSMTIPQKADFAINLNRIMGCETSICGWVYLLGSTAAQRAEAYLRTIGKWEGGSDE